MVVIQDPKNQDLKIQGLKIQYPKIQYLPNIQISVNQPYPNRENERTHPPLNFFHLISTWNHNL